jgi:hypothetical protein
MEQSMRKKSVCSIDHMTNFFLLWDRFKAEGLLKENKKYFCDLFFILLSDALGNEWDEERKNLILKQSCAFAQKQLGITGRRTLFFYKKKDREMHRILRRCSEDWQPKKHRAPLFLRILFYRFLASISWGDKRSFYLKKLEKCSKSSQ